MPNLFKATPISLLMTKPPQTPTLAINSLKICKRKRESLNPTFRAVTTLPRTTGVPTLVRTQKMLGMSRSLRNSKLVETTRANHPI